MLCQVILWSTFVVYLHTKVLPSFVRTFVPTYAKVLPSFVRSYVRTYIPSTDQVRTNEGIFYGIFYLRIIIKYEARYGKYEGRLRRYEGRYRLRTKVRRYEGMFFVMTACERMKPDQPLLRGIYLRRRQSWPMYRKKFGFKPWFK